MNNTDNKKNNVNELMVEELIRKATELPYVRIERQEFLLSILKNKSIDDIKQFINTGDTSIFSKEYLDKIAKKVIKEETYRSSAVSFTTGVPGGFSVAATIPADILQNLAHSLRLAQKLAYIYGDKDLYDVDGKLQEQGKNALITYFGVMLGVSSATTAIGLFSKNAPNEIVKLLKDTRVTKTVWYPILKNVLKYFGVKVTKESLKKGIQKAVPVIGGFVSGGVTYVGLSKSGERLRYRLSEVTFDYTEEKAKEDYMKFEKIVKDYKEDELKAI